MGVLFFRAIEESLNSQPMKGKEAKTKREKTQKEYNISEDDMEFLWPCKATVIKLKLKG